MRFSTPADTQAIYAMLRDMSFPYIDGVSYDEAKAAIEGSHNLLIERNGELAGWFNIHKTGDKLGLDLAISPKYRRKALTHAVCKQVLTYCFELGDSVVVESNNPIAIKLALLFGFTLSPNAENGAVTLELTKEAYNGKSV